MLISWPPSLLSGMIVTFHGFVTDSSVINDVCEPANLRTVVQLLLMVQLLLDEKPACLSEENISQMNAGYNNIMTVCSMFLNFYFKTKQTLCVKILTYIQVHVHGTIWRLLSEYLHYLLFHLKDTASYSSIRKNE